MPDGVFRLEITPPQGDFLKFTKKKWRYNPIVSRNLSIFAPICGSPRGRLTFFDISFRHYLLFFSRIADFPFFIFSHYRLYFSRRPHRRFWRSVQDAASQHFKYHAVGVVDFATVDGGEVDQGGLVGIVAEAFADDGDGHVTVAGDGCPGMAGDIHGKGLGKAGEASDVPELPVHVEEGALVLLAVVIARTPYDREQIFGGLDGISVDDFLHARLPSDPEALAGLAAPVRKDAVAEVGLLQIGHVHERHSSGEEAEHEHVTGKSQIAPVWKGHITDESDDVERNGPLDRPGHACVHSLEWIVLRGDAPGDGTVVDGPEYPEIE